MSEQPTGGNIPEITLGWRLQLALGDMKVQEMADTLGVNRATIGRWMHDRGAPKRAYILQWALATGVDAQWLEHGTVPNGDGPSGLSKLRAGGTKPTDYKHRGAGNNVITLHRVA